MLNACVAWLTDQCQKAGKPFHILMSYVLLQELQVYFSSAKHNLQSIILVQVTMRMQLPFFGNLMRQSAVDSKPRRENKPHLHQNQHSPTSENPWPPPIPWVLLPHLVEAAGIPLLETTDSTLRSVNFNITLPLIASKIYAGTNASISQPCSKFGHCLLCRRKGKLQAALILDRTEKQGADDLCMTGELRLQWGDALCFWKHLICDPFARSCGLQRACCCSC